jgi:hypothetical protein
MKSNVLLVHIQERGLSMDEQASNCEKMQAEQETARKAEIKASLTMHILWQDIRCIGCKHITSERLLWPENGGLHTSNKLTGKDAVNGDN